MTLLDRSPAAPEVWAERPRLLGLAYRMLGDANEAEDVVQETFARWLQADAATVRTPEAWLSTVATRLAVDRLRRLRTERAAYTGPWLPEPIATAPLPDRAAEERSDLSLALLVMLERLAPEERAAFVLREVFDTGYDEIARILERSEAAVRQMVHRARERVRAGRPRFAVQAETVESIFHRFVAALAADDADAMLALLAPEVTYTSDGGGKVSAARNVIRGPERILRLLRSLERKYAGHREHRWTTVNGEPALVTTMWGALFSVTAVRVDGGRIGAMYSVMNPDKLSRATGGVVEVR